MKKVSIKDIAREVGVVPSTVSLVLNDKAKQGRISDQLAQKIRDVANQMNYQPNYAAVSLRTGKTNVIGLVVENISNPFFASLAKVLEDEAYQHNYRILYCSTENNDERGVEMVKMLFHQQVDGYLITPSPGMENVIQKLVEAEKPIVLIDRYFTELQVPSTLVNNYSGIEQSVTHLIKKGYQKIGFVTTDLAQVQMQSREDAFRHLVKKRQHQELELILEVPYKLDHDKKVKLILDYLKQHPDMDAIIFSTNYLGIAGLESIQLFHKKIPEEIGVICFDDHDVFRLHNPAITSVVQPIEKIANTAINLLLKQLKENHPTYRKQVIEHKPKLIVRSST